MRTVTHRELRNSSGEILRAAQAGETIQVTNHGTVVAVIGPPPTDTIADLVARGLARPASLSPSALADLEPQSAPVSTKEILDDVRGPW